MTAEELFHELPSFDAVGYKTDAQRLVITNETTDAIDIAGTVVR